MKVLYITFWDFQLGTADGVVKKIFQQIDVMEKSGLNVDLIYYNGKSKKMLRNRLNCEKEIGICHGIKGISKCTIIKKYLKNHKYECVYIRRLGRTDPWVISMLNTLKGQKSKIYFEFPTFPYRMKEDTLLAKMDAFLDKKCCVMLKKFVDYAITYSEDKEIYGMPTIRIINGINVEGINRIKNQKKDNMIHLLGVALMQPSHGYERVIEGMNRYKQAGGSRIDVSLVGEGPEKTRYVNLVSRYGLEKEIKFYPFLSGKELDDLYEQADMTLIDFGAYKQGIYCTSALKSRESLAKGLPLVTACKIDICNKDSFPYVLEFPNDESQVELFKIEEFYESISEKENKISMANKIRQYASEHVDISNTFVPVINQMLRENNE